MIRAMQNVRVLALTMLAAAAHVAGAYQVPPRPADGAFIQDYAGLIPVEARQRIGELQRQAYEQHDTPIIVVTIEAMSRYGYAGAVEAFARDWFDAWGIGKQTERGLANRGMLVLVSAGDRKARIELGADWGRAGDASCQAIMQRQMVPAFRSGRYADGIEMGVASLLGLAAIGPAAHGAGQAPAAAVPGAPSACPVPGRSIDDIKVSTSPLRGSFLLIGTLIGAGLVLVGLFFPEHRGAFLKIGLAVLAVTWLTWIVFVVLGMFAKGRSRGRGWSGGSGGGFSSGGGFGGGFSGGGGATGSW